MTYCASASSMTQCRPTRHQPGLRPQWPDVHGEAIFLGRVVVDIEQAVAVRTEAQEQPARDWMPKRSLSRPSGTCGAGTCRPSSFHVERDDADAAAGSGLPSTSIFSFAAQLFIARPVSSCSRALITSTPTLSLIWKTRPAFERLQDARRAGFLAFLDAADEVLVGHADVVDRAAGADAGRQVAVVDPFVEDEHAAGTGTAEELVRRDEDRVDARIVTLASVARDSYRYRRTVCRPRSRNRRSHRTCAAGWRSTHVGLDARHVRCRRERTDALAALVARVLEQSRSRDARGRYCRRHPAEPRSSSPATGARISRWSDARTAR